MLQRQTYHNALDFTHLIFSLLRNVDGPQRQAVSLWLQENFITNLCQTMNGFSKHFHI